MVSTLTDDEKQKIYDSFNKYENIRASYEGREFRSPTISQELYDVTVTLEKVDLSESQREDLDRFREVQSFTHY